MKLISLGKYVLVLLSIFFGGRRVCAQQDSTQMDTLLVGGYLEGPHIRFIAEDRITVFYIRHDSIKDKTKKISKSFRFKKDTIVFKGFAGDNVHKYIVPRHIKPQSGDTPPAEKIIVLGDIHGEYKSLLSILRYNKVIDEKNQWAFGKGHLVFTGDVFDRGNKVTECLWFIFQLEIQAQKKGGKVHYLLGNHEMMAILFDDRYVTDKYQHAARFINFHYSHFFDKFSVLGRWLRSKNTMVRIGNQLFVHGGISPKLLEKNMKIDEINVTMRYYLNNYVQVTDTSLMDLFLYSHSPLWYRGYLSREPQYDRITFEDVMKTLDFYESEVIIFGHTPVARIYPFYQFKLIAMDVPIGNPNYIDQGLLIEDQKYYRIFTNKKKQRLR